MHRTAITSSSLFRSMALRSRSGIRLTVAVVSRARVNSIEKCPCGIWARAGLLANSGCFVSKCVLWCFAGVCDVLRVFCGVLRVFCSISTKHTKHPKNIEKH